MEICLNELKKVHFIGVCGIGISAIARLLKSAGKDVSGSDIKSSPICDNLEKIGIKIKIGHSEKNVSEDIDLVIYSPAVPDNNQELEKAKRTGIRTINYPQALGLIFNDKTGIAVCGTHGKSTTTAMIGLVLDDAELDPSIIIGSIIPRYNSNLRLGKSKYFVAEACEYKRSFLYLRPKITILNNIELDHTDYYRDIDDLRNAFREFVGNLPHDGILICNGDDLNIKILNTEIKVNYPELKIISFGQDKENTLQVSDFRFEIGITKYRVSYLGKDLGEFYIRVPGLFNLYNSLATISLGLVLDISVENIRESLANFAGIWRRFEIKGIYKNTLIVSDYAHHPTAVKMTIEAAKNFYPRRRIFAIFQPHQHNRVNELYKYFLECFNAADVIILSEIFDVAGREEKEDLSLSSLDLVEDIKKNDSTMMNRIFYARSLKETRNLIDEKIEDGDLLLIMAAGDMYKIVDEMIRFRDENSF